MTRQRMSRDQLAEYVGRQVQAAEDDLDRFQRYELPDLPDQTLLLASCAHSLLAVAACLMEVWQEDVKPASGSDVTGHPFQLRPGSGNLCQTCDGIPGDPQHYPARWDPHFPTESDRSGAFPGGSGSR